MAPLALRDDACWKRRLEPQESALRSGANDARSNGSPAEEMVVCACVDDSGGTRETIKELIEQEVAR